MPNVLGKASLNRHTHLDVSCDRRSVAQQQQTKQQQNHKTNTNCKS